MGGINSGSDGISLTPPKEKKKATDIVIGGVPPGASVSAGNDSFSPGGAGDSDDNDSGPAGNETKSRDPNQGRGGHPTELGEKQGRSLLDPDDGSKRNRDGTVDKLGDSGQHVFEMKEDKPRGSIGPAIYEQQRAKTPDAKTKGGGNSDDGAVSLDEQMENIRERREQKEREQKKKERVEHERLDELERIERVEKMERQRQNRKAAKGTFGRNIYEQMRGQNPAPGPSGPVDSGDRRPNLLDMASKPPASVQNARAFYDRLRGTTPAKPPGSPSKPDPRDTINRDALRDIAAFDKEVAPQAEEWEGRAETIVAGKSILKSLRSGNKTAAEAVVTKITPDGP